MIWWLKEDESINIVKNMLTSFKNRDIAIHIKFNNQLIASLLSHFPAIRCFSL